MIEAVCIASGPSLTESDCELVRWWRAAREDRRVFVCNNAYTMAPWADLLFAGDGGWIEHYGGDDFNGERISASSSARTYGWEKLPGDVKRYNNSGTDVISLAIHRGALRVYMLAYDCKRTGGKTHFHGSHVGVLKNGRKLKDATNMHEWPSLFAALATDAKARGVEIINCTRETALKCFPRKSLEACLAEPAPVD